MKFKSLLYTVLGALAYLTTHGALAQSQYPEHPISVVVPYAPGGGTDSSARIVTNALQELTGNTFIIENIPGAGTTIGANKVAKANPDGYTLLYGGLSANVLAPYIYENVADIDPDAFEPVALVATQPLVLVVNSKSDFEQLEELLEYAAQHPEELNFGSPGQGSAPHLISELFLVEAGVQATHIPFRGAAPALTALLSGDIDFFLDTPTAPIPHINEHKLRALGISSLETLEGLDNISLMSEHGVEGFEATTWFAFFAPKGTSTEILEDLNKWVNEALKKPHVNEQMSAAYLYLAPGSRADLADFVQAERERWTAIIDAKGLKQE